MVEAIFHVVRSGCAWRPTPRLFPPWHGVPRLTCWRRDGTPGRLHSRLRAEAREAEGAAAEPSAAVADSRTVRAATVGGPARGYDAVGRTAGRKRHAFSVRLSQYWRHCPIGTSASFSPRAIAAAGIRLRS